MNFNELNWSGAYIRATKLDRKNPGLKDVITLEVEWPQTYGKSTVVFEGVCWASFNLIFGPFADKTITRASELGPNDPDLINFYNGWKGLFDGIKLNVYLFDINPIGREIKIIAEKFTVE